MTLTKRNKIIIGAVALAGAAAVTGSAFTAGGLTDSSSDDFIGGTVTVAISGAVITNVDYDIGVSNEIDSITVTLTGNVETRTLEVELYDGATLLTPAYTCTAITSGVSTCTTAGTKTVSTDVTQVIFRVDN